MAFDNTVVLVGNCTADPELRFTPSGQAIATFSIAVNRRWQNRQTGAQEEQVSFFEVKCWQQLAENVAETITKGSRVLVSGRLEQSSWQTKEGDKRYKIEVVADEVAPSLRYATAQVVRNERREGFDGGGNSGGANSGSGGASRPAPNDPPAGYDNDEEPF
jgi:single-strand DNA-binding protein